MVEVGTVRERVMSCFPQGRGRCGAGASASARWWPVRSASRYLILSELYGSTVHSTFRTLPYSTVAGRRGDGCDTVLYRSIAQPSPSAHVLYLGIYFYSQKGCEDIHPPSAFLFSSRTLPSPWPQPPMVAGRGRDRGSLHQHHTSSMRLCEFRLRP